MFEGNLREEPDGYGTGLFRYSNTVKITAPWRRVQWPTNELAC